MATDHDYQSISLPRRSRAAILAGLYLLLAHAEDGYESPEVLEVGEPYNGLASLSPHEIKQLIQVISEYDS